MQEIFSLVSPDSPKTHPSDDLLGYAPLAEHLADSISHITPTNGFVIGIHGPWGCGKTTFINFLKCYVQDSLRQTTPQDAGVLEQGAKEATPQPRLSHKFVWRVNSVIKATCRGAQKLGKRISALDVQLATPEGRGQLGREFIGRVKRILAVIGSFLKREESSPIKPTQVPTGTLNGPTASVGMPEKVPESTCIIMIFNPWWYSGDENLARMFLTQLCVLFEQKKIFSDKNLKMFTKFAELVSKSEIPYIATPARFVLKTTSKQQDVNALKEKIVKSLKEANKKILVLVDDIDRLTKNEITQLFRVVKSVADFPNIIYLLAFDKAIVSKALQEVLSTSGDSYLEKIIQFSLDLPIPDKTTLRTIFFRSLDALFSNTATKLGNESYWANVYLDGIDHFINTPRDIVRLINALSITFPPIKEEVNPVDFVAIESVRLFSADAYNIIKENGKLFYIHPDDYIQSSSRLDDLKKFHDAWIEKIPEQQREPIRRLLKRIFPKLQEVWGGTAYGSNWEERWRKELRICSPEKFPVYFRFSIPQGSISHSELMAILGMASDEHAFSEKLLELSREIRPDGTTRVRVLLDEMVDYTKNEIPVHSIPHIVRTFLNIGDEINLRADERSGFFEIGNDTRIMRLLYQILQRLDEAQRFEVLKTGAQTGRALATIAREIGYLDEQHGRFGSPTDESSQEEQLVTEEHLTILKGVTLQRIRNVARNHELLSVAKLPRVLRLWKEWADIEEVKEWVREIIVEDRRFVRFLQSFSWIQSSCSGPDLISRTQLRLDPESLRPFLDPDEIIMRCRSLVDNTWLSNEQKEIIAQFISEYEIRRKGGDPGSILLRQQDYD